jgi:hypothetical protein
MYNKQMRTFGLFCLHYTIFAIIWAVLGLLLFFPGTNYGTAFLNYTVSFLIIFTATSISAFIVSRVIFFEKKHVKNLMALVITLALLIGMNAGNDGSSIHYKFDFAQWAIFMCTMTIPFLLATFLFLKSKKALKSSIPTPGTEMYPKK